jgi:hypothetical protein
MRSTVGILVSVLLAFSFACGGGSGSGGGVISGGSSGSSTLAASFTAAQPAPPPDSVAMAPGGATGPVVTIRINVTDLSDLFGADFDITYNSTNLEYVSYSAGTALEANGGSVSYLVEPQPGLLVVGASRNGGATGGVDVTGTKPLIHLTFRARRAASSVLSFESAALFDAQSPPQTIPGISWHGGTLVAN